MWESTYVSDKYYEILEIHNLSRGLFGITVKIIKPATQNVWNGINREYLKIPSGSVGFVISNTNTVPTQATFYPVTKSLSNIHKRVDFLKEILKNPNLEVTLNDKKYKWYK